jgi:hypothetical protein
MEMMVAMSIGLVVTASMVALMSSSLHNTVRIVKMNKLAEDLRTTMQMMSRDVRRSSYTANAVYCFGNPDCSSLGSVGSAGSVLLPGDVTISNTNDCLMFNLDRDHDGDATEDGAGGFRRVVADGVGQIQMWIGNATPACGSSDENWVTITDADEMNITSFDVNDDLSYDEVLLADGGGNPLFSQRVRRISMVVEAQLTTDSSITRTIENTIKVRNNFWF